LHQLIYQGSAFLCGCDFDATGPKTFHLELENAPLVLQNATHSPGKYSFDISVVGDNFDPVSSRVFLDWKPDWNFEDVWIE
jgi:hypothetical protein